MRESFPTLKELQQLKQDKITKEQNDRQNHINKLAEEFPIDFNSLLGEISNKLKESVFKKDNKTHIYIPKEFCSKYEGYKSSKEISNIFKDFLDEHGYQALVGNTRLVVYLKRKSKISLFFRKISIKLISGLIALMVIMDLLTPPFRLIGTSIYIK